MARAGLADVLQARSAGVDALPGEPMCPQADARLGPPLGPPPRPGGARPLSAQDLAAADLILALDRSHRSACARLLPACRPRLFTLRQGAALADVVGAMLAAGQAPPGSPPLPTGRAERVRWLVGELDAARGALAGSAEADAEIVDRHGPAPHEAVFDEVAAAVDALARCVAAVLVLAA